MARALIVTFVLLLAVTVRAGDRFPKVTGTALTGDEVTLPTDLDKPFTLLAIVFKQKQQADVDTWISKMEAIEDKRDDFAFYQVPTICEMSPLRRWFVRRGMLGRIHSERARARTVTLHIDKEPFKRALEIEDERRIQLFLVDEDGEVVWRTGGVWDFDKEYDLVEWIR